MGRRWVEQVKERAANAADGGVEPIAHATMLQLALIALAFSRTALAHPDAGDSPRVVVRDVSLLTLDESDPATVRAHVTIIIERERIVEVRPSEDDDLRPGDILVSMPSAFVLPGLIEATREQGVTFDACARRTVDGVTTLLGPWTATERAWLSRIAETAAFRIPSLLPLAEPVPVSNTPSEPVTREDRARRLRALTAGAARDYGLTDRGRIEVGQRADLLLLTDDPLENLDVVRRPAQMLLAGRPLRISELETNRSMQMKARAAIEAFGSPESGRRPFLIESGGLQVGRLDLEPTAASGLERWAPPISQRSAWQLSGTPKEWTLQLEETSSGSPTFLIRLTRQGDQLNVHVKADEPNATPTDTTIDAKADGPILDPISLAITQRERTLALAVGAEFSVDLAETGWREGGLVLGIRSVQFLRIEPADSAMPLPPKARAFRLADSGGATLGWLATDSEGLPIRAALIAPEGITEYLAPLASRAAPAGGPASLRVDPKPSPRITP